MISTAIKRGHWDLRETDPMSNILLLVAPVFGQLWFPPYFRVHFFDNFEFDSQDMIPQLNYQAATVLFLSLSLQQCCLAHIIFTTLPACPNQVGTYLDYFSFCKRTTWKMKTDNETDKAKQYTCQNYLEITFLLEGMVWWSKEQGPYLPHKIKT